MIFIYIRRPLVGHQAVRGSFEVYNSIASIDRLQTSKYIAPFSPFKSSCNLFLCCYRATGQYFYHPRGVSSQIGDSPRIRQKSIEKSILIVSFFASKITLKM